MTRKASHNVAVFHRSAVPRCLKCALTQHDWSHDSAPSPQSCLFRHPLAREPSHSVHANALHGAGDKTLARRRLAAGRQAQNSKKRGNCWYSHFASCSPENRLLPSKQHTAVSRAVASPCRRQLDIRLHRRFVRECEAPRTPESAGRLTDRRYKAVRYISHG